jgi:hypothetical protein
MIVARAFLIIQPERRGRDGAVVSISIDRVVKTKPVRLGVRDVPIELVLRIDEKLFLPVEPTIVVELKDARQIVEVGAEIPTCEPAEPEEVGAEIPTYEPAEPELEVPDGTGT